MPDNDDAEINVYYRGTVVPFSGRLKHTVFGKDVTKFYLPENFDGTIQGWLDPANEYNHNNYGYRGPDLSFDVDLLAAGDSVTYGVGVPEDGTWPALLADSLGWSYSKLAKPGASAEWIVDQLFRYFTEFGNPKNLVVLFPDMFRGEIVVNTSVNTTRDIDPRDFMNQAMDSNLKRGVISYASIDPRTSSKPMLAKKPFPIEDTLPPEAGVYRAFRHIRMLETYCKAVGINLVWGSWSGDLAELVRDMPEELSVEGFVHLKGLEEWMNNVDRIPVTAEDPEGIMDHKLQHTDEPFKDYGCTATESDRSNCICIPRCHDEYVEKYPESFYMGTDRHVRGLGDAHMGVHRHLHVAEDFESELRRRLR